MLSRLPLPLDRQRDGRSVYADPEAVESVTLFDFDKSFLRGIPFFRKLSVRGSYRVTIWFRSFRYYVESFPYESEQEKDEAHERAIRYQNKLLEFVAKKGDL